MHEIIHLNRDPAATAQNEHCTTSDNRGSHLELVPDLPLDTTYSVAPTAFETPIVTEIRRPPRNFSLRHLQSIPALPDNVFILHPNYPELTA